MEKPDGSAAVPARASRPSRINRSIVFIGGLLALSLFTLLPWNTYHSSEPPVSFQTSLSKPQLDFEKSVAAVLADTLNEFGRNYDIAEFKHASDHIHNIIRTYPTGAQSRSLKKRGFFSALGSLFPGGGGATAAGATGATGATAAGGGGGLLSGALSSAASSLLGGAAGGGGGGLLSGLATAIAPAANALGVGVGQGAVKGLDLKTKPNAAQPTYTGINAIAENLGEGVTSSLLGSVDTSALTSSIAPSGAAIGQAATSLGQGLGGGAASGLKLTQATQSLNPADNATGLNAVVGGLGFGLTSSFLGNFDTSSLTSGSGISSMLAQIPAPAGKGLGEGAAQGLGLSGTASPAIAARAAASGAVDVSGITESFTNSLAATFLGQVKTSGAVSSVNTASLLKQVAIAAGPLGTGLGLGGAQGLAKLTASNSASNTSVARIRRQAASDPTSIGGIAQTFSQNLASNFVGNIDTSNIAPQNLGGSLLKTIAQAAPGIGTGLGSGAAQGLNLSSSPASTTSPDQADVSSIAESFSSGLSSSFVTRQNIAALAKDLGSSGTLSNAQAMIVPAALGLGKGLGGGAAVALGNQQAVVLPNGSDVESIAQNFAQGLSQNFLANGTLQSLQKTLTSTATSGLSNIKIANVSEGLAIGLVDGLGSSLSIGQTVNNDAVTFNDTVDGAAVGFGRGLGSAAGGLAQELFKNATKGVTSTRKKRSIGTTELAVLDTGLSKRVDIQATIGNLTSNLNLTTVQNLLQTSIDDLTCVGVGGLLQVLTGLEDSGTLKFGNSKLTGLLPTGVLNITSGGNEFQFQSPELTISVNGLPQPKLTALLVAHSKCSA